MLEIVIAGGWMMAPIVLCSVVAAAIVIERLWTLQTRRVVPQELSRQVWDWVSSNKLNHQHLQELRTSSPLGQLLAAGLASRRQDRAGMKEAVEDAGRHVVHELERYLNTLGSIASVSPLLGLLGSVTGMIRTFGALTYGVTGDPAALAGGISQALITTAAGLMVAIPALIAYRYLHGRVATLIVRMEKEAIAFLDALDRKHWMDTLGRSSNPIATQIVAQNAAQGAAQKPASAGGR
jgi:biopolymer transport protein ExbB